MKLSLYDAIQVSKLAEPEVIEAACLRLIQKYESDSSPDSQYQLKLIRHAYEILSDPAQRAFYDQSLKKQELQSQSATSKSAKYSSEYQSDYAESFNGWWGSSKVTWIIIATVALIGFSLFTKHTGEKNKVEIVHTSETTKRQANELNAANQATLVTGVIENQNKYADIAQQQEERRRIELQYRADESARILDMRRQEQEARLEAQRIELASRQEMQKKQQADREAHAEEQRVEREKRYYACLNSALNNYTYSKAQSMCRR